MAEEEIGTRIKSLRESRSMTQEELGVILGMSKRAVEGIESGRRSNIRADKIKLVCETFHEYPGYLLYGHGHDYWKSLFTKANPMETPEAGLEGGIIPLIVRRAVEDTLGAEGLTLLNSIRQLNNAGQKRAKTLIEDLLKIREYRRETRPHTS